MLKENQIRAATDAALPEKNKNKSKRLLNERRTAHQLPSVQRQTLIRDIFGFHLKARMEKHYLFYYLIVYGAGAVINVVGQHTFFIAQKTGSQISISTLMVNLFSLHRKTI